ncbi:MAG TPA: TetR/AcrR family transcriptional regulator [Acidimicrobiales bacterium]|jgi:AcrR family transcriptional regulator
MPSAAPADLDAPRRPGRPRDPEAGRNILEATMTELAEHGFGGLTIEAVAHRAGVSKATIYRRWPSKAALVLDAASSLVPQPALEDTGSLHDDLVTTFSASYLDLEKPYGNLMGALIAEAMVNDDVRTLIGEYSRTRRSSTLVLVERAVERGELPPSVDADLLLELVAGALLYRKVVSGLELDRAFIEQAVEVALRGVCAGQ